MLCREGKGRGRGGEGRGGEGRGGGGGGGRGGGRWRQNLPRNVVHLRVAPFAIQLHSCLFQNPFVPGNYFAIAQLHVSHCTVINAMLTACDV